MHITYLGCHSVHPVHRTACKPDFPQYIAFFKSSIVGNIVSTVVHQDLHILEPVGSGCAHYHRIYFQAVCFKAGDHGAVFRRKAARLATEHAVIFVDGRLCPVDLDFLTI